MIPSIFEQLNFHPQQPTEKQLGYEETILDFIEGRNARTKEIIDGTGIPKTSVTKILAKLKKENRVTNWSTHAMSWWTLSPSELHRRKRCSIS